MSNLNQGAARPCSGTYPDVVPQRVPLSEIQRRDASVARMFVILLPILIPVLFPVAKSILPRQAYLSAGGVIEWLTTSPNRYAIFVMGLTAGLVVGPLSALFVDYVWDPYLACWHFFQQADNHHHDAPTRLGFATTDDCEEWLNLWHETRASHNGSIPARVLTSLVWAYTLLVLRSHLGHLNDGPGSR